MDNEEVDYFISLLQPRTIKRKEYLLRPNEVCKYERFITKGGLRTYTIDNSGFEYIVVFAVENWWTGDLFGFQTQTSGTFVIDALEDTDLLQIPKYDLEKLYESVPKFERYFRIIFQNTFVAHRQRINQNLSFTAEERTCIL